MRLLIVWASVVLLAGCATAPAPKPEWTWRPPSAMTPDDARRELYQCVRDSETLTPLPRRPLPLFTDPTLRAMWEAKQAQAEADHVENMLRLCLESKGFVQELKPAAQ